MDLRDTRMLNALAFSFDAEDMAYLFQHPEFTSNVAAAKDWETDLESIIHCAVMCLKERDTLY